MRLILGTIIFWIMILGINKFLENKFHINKNFTLVLTFSLIGIIVFIAGILNIMKIVSLLLTISFGLTIFTKNNSSLHDLVCKTTVVDLTQYNLPPLNEEEGELAWK